MDPLARFQAHRAALRSLAYRLLGSATEAEDALQDAWLRWQTADLTSVHDDRAFLVTTLTRLCIDRLTSARARRETYPGPWLPEPVLTATPLDLASISLGVLMLLERLTPVERAVFVLCEVFDHSHAEAAEALQISEATSRQSLHRAREQVAAGRRRFPADRAHHERLLRGFVEAMRSGDVAAMTALLAADAELHADSGGKVRGAALRPVHGGPAIARFFAGLVAKMPPLAALDFTVTDVNGWPAMVARVGDQAVLVITVETDDQHVTTVRNLLNPEKLALPRID